MNKPEKHFFFGMNVFTANDSFQILCRGLQKRKRGKEIKQEAWFSMPFQKMLTLHADIITEQKWQAVAWQVYWKSVKTT